MVRDLNSENVLKSIIVTRARDGASIVNIMSDYIELIGEPWPMADKSFSEIKEYLEEIDGIYSERLNNGEILWFTNSRPSQHLTQMIKEQKPARVISDYRKRKVMIPAMKFIQYNKYDDDYGDDKLCFYKDNYVYRQKRLSQVNRADDFKRKQNTPNTHLNNRPQPPIATLYDQLLVGDDFFMAIATAELGIKYAKRGRVRYSGYCVSGQSIRDAAERIRKATYFEKDSVIINLGSVDILHGHDLVDMRYDYEYLIEQCLARNLKPTITTLAPIANCNHNDEIRQKIIYFNNYLMDKYSKMYMVIDLYTIMVSPRGCTLFDCFQPDSKYVTGSNQPHVLWNRIGRQRVLKLIKSKI